MAHDHVYDEDGNHIATVEGGMLIDDVTRKATAEVRDGMLFGLDGTPLNRHLADVNGPAFLADLNRRALGGE